GRRAVAGREAGLKSARRRSAPGRARADRGGSVRSRTRGRRSAPGEPVLTRLSRLAPGQAEAVTHLAQAVTAADGYEAFSEQMLLNLTDDHREVTHLLLTAPAGSGTAGAVAPTLPGTTPGQGDAQGEASSAVDLLGYAQIDGGAADASIQPDHRRRGPGRRLVTAVLTEPQVRPWAHADVPAAAALAGALDRAR